MINQVKNWISMMFSDGVAKWSVGMQLRLGQRALFPRFIIVVLQVSRIS